MGFFLDTRRFDTSATDDDATPPPPDGGRKDRNDRLMYDNNMYTGYDALHQKTSSRKSRDYLPSIYIYKDKSWRNGDSEVPITM